MQSIEHPVNCEKREAKTYSSEAVASVFAFQDKFQLFSFDLFSVLKILDLHLFLPLSFYLYLSPKESDENRQENGIKFIFLSRENVEIGGNVSLWKQVKIINWKNAAFHSDGQVLFAKGWVLSIGYSIALLNLLQLQLLLIYSQNKIFNTLEVQVLLRRDPTL